MREAELQKVKPVIYIIDDLVIESEKIPEDIDDDQIERMMKDQFRQAGEALGTIQKEMLHKLDGYILYMDNIYKVYHNNGLVKLIHGQEAKEIKRRIKASQNQ